MFDLYDNCPSCGHLHDDGGTYQYRQESFWLCIDCLDKIEYDDKADEVHKNLDKFLERRNCNV